MENLRKQIRSKKRELFFLSLKMMMSGAFLELYRSRLSHCAQRERQRNKKKGIDNTFSSSFMHKYHKLNDRICQWQQDEGRYKEIQGNMAEKMRMLSVIKGV